jgi:hypothetical protein
MRNVSDDIVVVFQVRVINIVSICLSLTKLITLDEQIIMQCNTHYKTATMLLAHTRHQRYLRCRK